MDDALSRRIEELAGFDDSEGTPHRDDVAVNAVRAEVVAVRADLASLRGEIGSVRTDLDGLGGRLTGSVAASRTETGTLVRRVAELTTRLEAVGTRVDEVRTAVPGLGRELREGLDLIPVRTSAALDEITTRISDGLGSRVDAAIGDVRRTVGTALDTGSRSASASQAALVDARTALESRLANLEDAIDAVSERIDSLVRDSTARVTERMTAFGQQVADLSTRVEASGAEQVERTVARLRDVTETGLDALSTQVNEQVRVSTGDLRREVTAALARQERESAETRESVEALAESVRAALTGFATALTSGLTGLGSTVSDALGESREETRVELDALTERLLSTVGDLDAGVRRHQAETAGRIDALQSALEARSESVRSGVTAALAGVRADLGSEVGVLRPLLEGVATDVAGGAAAATLLRGDLLDALESVRERIATSSTASIQGVRSTLDATRAELTDGSRQLRQTVLDRLEEQHVDLLGRLDAQDVSGAERRGQLEALSQALGHARTELAALLASETDRGAARVGEHVAASTQALEQALAALSATLVEKADAQVARTDEVGAAVTGKLDEVTAAAVAQTVASQDSATALGDRVAASDEALAASVREALAAQAVAVSESQGVLVRRVDDAQGALAARVEEFAEAISTRFDSTSEAGQLRIDETRTVLTARVDELAHELEELREQLASGTTDVTTAGDALLAHLQTHDGAVRDLLWELGRPDSAVPRPPGTLTSAEVRQARHQTRAATLDPTAGAAKGKAAPRAKAAEAAPKQGKAVAAAKPAKAAKAVRTAKAAPVAEGVEAPEVAEVPQAPDAPETTAAPEALEASGAGEVVTEQAEQVDDAAAATPPAGKATRAAKAAVRPAAKAAPAKKATKAAAAKAARTRTAEPEELAAEDEPGTEAAAGPRSTTRRKAPPRTRAVPPAQEAPEDGDEPATEGDGLSSFSKPAAAAPPWAQGARNQAARSQAARSPAARRERLEQATSPVSPEVALDAAAPPAEEPAVEADTASLDVGARRQSWSSPPPEPAEEPSTTDEPERRFFRRRR